MIRAHRTVLLTLVLTFGLAFVGCDSATTESSTPVDGTTSDGEASEETRGGGALDDSYSFSAVVYDIAATPYGSVLVAQNESVKELRRGETGHVIDVPVPSTTPPTTLNGLAAIGRSSFFAATGGGDLAEGAGVWRGSRGNVRLVADIEAFETMRDPDATEGLEWKDPACEFNPGAGFSAGPQSNPYHLVALSGREALVADAAGNALLSTRTNGEIDWIAVFTPPTADGSGSDQPEDWLVLFPLDETTDCYVQPVPTSVAVASDGAYYVGELTGVTPENLGGMSSPSLSRVWRIEPGATNVACPSNECSVAFSGFTSVIDVAFGPDGDLYVVEYDENDWFTATTLGNPAGGTLNRCDVEAESCEEVVGDLPLPSAITFDKRGNLWLLENNIIAPTVRVLD